MTAVAPPDFRILFEKAPALFLVVDPDFIIRAASDGYLEATMIDRDTAIGRPLFELFPDNPNDHTADGVNNLSLSLMRAVRLGKTDVMSIQKYDMRRPDGEFEERYWSCTNAPVIDAHGRLRWIIHRAEDVTGLVQLQHGQEERDALTRAQQQTIDRLRATNEALSRSEMALRESQGFLKATQAIAKIGTWRSGDKSGTLEWSPETFEMFGMDPAGPPPTVQRMFAAMTPETRAAAEAALLARPLPETVTFTCRVRRPDGTERTCWVEGHLSTDAKGRRSLAGVCQDITEREAAAAQLVQAQKMESVGQLTGGLAHDFNNLLAVIIGNLDLLAEEFPADAPARDLADTALQAALKGSELTRQLLAFSRRQPLDPMVLDLNELIAGMDPLWRRSLGGAILVQLNLAPDLWAAKVDRAQMESALLNLVINARDAMPAGGSLAVETVNVSLDDSDPDLTPGDYAVVAVSDTGHGMSAEVLARAFEPFFTTKGPGEGSGLGLSVVYGFAKQSGGQLKIYSEVGVGTTVRLYLPRTKLAGAESLPETEPLSVTGEGERVLIVEDNPDVRRVVVRQLTDLGYEVVEAESGASGLAVLAADPTIDLLFTDIVMPGGMNGIEMVTTARLARPDLRVLFTTGFTSAAASIGGRLTGNDPLITKPYRRAALAAKLREALSR